MFKESLDTLKCIMAGFVVKEPFFTEKVSLKHLIVCGYKDLSVLVEYNSKEFIKYIEGSKFTSTRSTGIVYCMHGFFSICNVCCLNIVLIGSNVQC